MKVSEIGEFGLIDELAAMVNAEDRGDEAHRNLVIGIGDDAAAWRNEDGLGLATIDALVQDVHFNLGMTSWEELGWKSLAVNLSDIAAMGGSPRYALVSMALPEVTEASDVVSFYRGMLALARKFEVAIVGGNISRAPLVTVNVTVFGAANSPESLLTRASARAGDRVAVTGHLGAAAGGLEMLANSLNLDAESSSALRQAFLRPVPRVSEGKTLAESGVRTAIDISDGLVSDLGHICRASRLSARINATAVPVAHAIKDKFGARSLGLALSGGDDYELLFTAPAAVMEAVQAALPLRNCPVTVIGEMVHDTAAIVTVLDEDGTEIEVPNSGWDHFVAGKHGD